MPCCTVFAKIALICSNVFYMFLSVGLVGFGTFFVVHHAEIELVIGNESIGWFVAFILVGLVTFSISLVGIIGSAVGNHKVLFAYMIATLILSIVLLIGTGVSLSSAERNSQYVGDQFMKFIKEYTPPGNDTDSSNEDANDVVEIVQEELTCCGLYGPSDWYNTTYGIPESCTCDMRLHAEDVCRELTPFEQSISTDANGIWKQGCNDTLEAIVQAHFFLMGSFTFLFAFMEIGTVFIALALCVCILKTRKRRQRIERLQSVAYTPLDSYPASTVSNQQFVTGDDDELLKDGEITMKI